VPFSEVKYPATFAPNGLAAAFEAPLPFTPPNHDRNVERARSAAGASSPSGIGPPRIKRSRMRFKGSQTAGNLPIVARKAGLTAGATI
jgi:hypothetical protein